MSQTRTKEQNAQNLRAHQLRAVEALRVIDAICIAHDIPYFLIAGSALGAVRHGGFIPWDDDIDIGMRPAAYDCFVALAPSLLKGRYVWERAEDVIGFPRLSSRISLSGDPLITVFPIVACGNTPFQKYSQWLIRKIVSPIYQRKMNLPPSSTSAKQIFSFVVSGAMSIFFTQQSALRLLRWNERRFENRIMDWCINLYSKYSMQKESIRSEWINALRRVPFEDGEYPIFEAYDAYLTHLYGNYLKLPPESDRVPVHLPSHK